MILYSILAFIGSLALVSWSGSWLVRALERIARYLGWREFVVAFFLMAFAGSLPNFAVGITSALRGIPELSFGDVVGGNVVDLSLSVAIVIFISRVAIPAEGATLQISAFWSSAIAVLPLILILDGNLSRADGLVLIFAFFLYIAWLFSKGERFKRIYNYGEEQPQILKEFKEFIKDLGRTVVGLFALAVGAQGVVYSSASVAQIIGAPIPVIGILIIGLGNCLPEIYFGILSARQGKTELILGDLMGAVIVPATLVLGLVVFLHPIQLEDFSPFAIARIFLIISAAIFYITARTGHRITRKEAIILLLLYIVFVGLELFTK